MTIDIGKAACSLLDDRRVRHRDLPPVGLIGGSDAQKRYCIGGGTVAVSGLSALLFARGRAGGGKA